MPAYAIEGLTVRFGTSTGRPVLADLGFQVGAGEILVTRTLVLKP